MSRKHAWILSGMGIIALVGLTATGCTPADKPADPDPAPSATEQAADPEETGVDEPAASKVVVGDDLAKLLLDADLAAELFPGVTEMGDASVFNASIGETEGRIGYPATCMPLLWPEDWNLTVGSRSAELLGEDGEVYGRQIVVQTPSIEQAEESFSWYRDAAESCDVFSLSYEQAEAVYEWTMHGDEERDDVEVIVGALTSDGEDYSSLQVQARAGNALVTFNVNRTDDPDADPKKIAGSIADALEDALGDLDHESVDLGSAAPASGGDMSEWEVGADGMGPIRLGDTVDDVVSAVEWIEEPVEGESFETNGSITMWRFDLDTSYLAITLTDGLISKIELKAIFDDYENPAVDGSQFPSAGGVRMGDSTLDVSEAFPGGTVVWLMSGGVEQYRVADAEGRTLTFWTPGLIVDGESLDDDNYDLERGVLTVYTVEDATKRQNMYEAYTTVIDDSASADAGTDAEAGAGTGGEGFATGTNTKLIKLDPWNDLAELPEDIGNEVMSCSRDGYRYDRIDCAVSAKCYVNEAGDQALCPNLTGDSRELEWSLASVGELSGPYDESADPRPMMLELQGGGFCRFSSGAGPMPPEGFNTWSGGCNRPGADGQGVSTVLWSTPDEGLYDKFGADSQLFLEPGLDGLLRIATGMEDKAPQLVGVTAIYW